MKKSMIDKDSTNRDANGGYAPVNGLKRYYEIRGAGEPLVLLHGGVGAIEMFGPNLPALAATSRLRRKIKNIHLRTLSPYGQLTLVSAKAPVLAEMDAAAEETTCR